MYHSVQAINVFLFASQIDENRRREQTKIKYEGQQLSCIVMITLYHYVNKADVATVDAVRFPHEYFNKN